jgi:hypothetical protein
MSPPFLLCQRCVEVQHEGIGIGAELGNDEGDPPVIQRAPRKSICLRSSR